MSFPLLQPPPPPPPPPQQQTITVYPNPVVTTHPPFTQSPSSHHSSGTFGTALLILAIIVVVSAVACCLGRLCNRGRDRRHDARPDTKKQEREDFKGGQRGNDGEFGFRRRDRGPSRPDNGHRNELRGETGGAPNAYDRDGGGVKSGGEGAEPSVPPA
ncbi:hypothetical protein MLD38_002466 [Melastoma candidum]|uniref:Uncharacterized protein n=1 Tax=Melastoma candidum TaxID=119954 RepID=A0ACB9S2H8_9MYRT|nr:hypothetical protein MLD38_002466 [Melastoma candidum]